MKTLRMSQAMGVVEVLGIASGREAGKRLLAEPSALPGSGIVILDFADIKLITASAARESVLKYCHSLTLNGALPVLVNVNEATRDELAFAADANRQPLVVAQVGQSGELLGARILGTLEPTQRDTLNAIAEFGEADAKTISKAKHSSAGATAWNNRLANLASLRLLKERKVGKTKLYSLTVEGLAHGN